MKTPIIDLPDNPLRSVVVKTIAVGVAIAIAPWLTGGQEPLAMLISVLAVVLGALMLWRQPEVRTLKRGPLSAIYGALVVWALLSLFWSVNRYSSTLWIVQLVLAGLVFRLAYSVAREAGGRELFVRLYLGTAAIFSVYGMWLLVTGTYPRLTGSFFWANPAAAYLIPAILIAVDRLKRDGGWLWIGALGLFGASFVLTDSRGAALVLALVLVPYLIASRLDKKHWIQLVFALIATISLTTVALQARSIISHGVVATVPGGRFEEAALGESQSGSDRINYLLSSVKLWEEHPFLGTGAGTFRDVHPEQQIAVVSASTDAHNFFVQTLPELGLFGFFLLVTLTALLLFGLLRGLLKGGDSLPLVLGCVALIIHMGLDIDASFPALLGLVAMLAGLVYSQGKTEVGTLPWRVPAVAVLLMIPIIPYYQGSVMATRAAAYQADGDLAAASDSYARSHQGFLYNPDWINGEGIALYAQATAASQPQQAQLATLALDRARQAEKLDPRDGQHHQLEGRILALQGDYSGAATALKRALALDPFNHPDYAYDLARVQALEGQRTIALQTARSMLALYPSKVIANRSADTSLRPALVGLATFVGTNELAAGNIASASEAAKLAVMYDPKDFRTEALRNAIDKATAGQ
jgi:O-antigen ligase/Flp pilus assembly protein TadD